MPKLNKNCVTGSKYRPAEVSGDINGALSIYFNTLQIPTTDAARVQKFLHSSETSAVKVNHNQKSSAKANKLRVDGNACLKNSDKEKALSLYTQSVAFAPPDSPPLALAFANRAAVLKDMGNYADSIAECQRALKAGYPDTLRYKLYVRLANCYQQLGQGQRALKSYNQTIEALDTSSLNEDEKEKIKLDTELKLKYLDDETEEEFEDLTRDISIGVLDFDVPSLGSHFNPEVPAASDCIALKYSKTFGRHLVATRDIEPGEVLIVEEPFAAVLEPELWSSHCSHCFKLCCTLLPCQHCAWAMFCSETCLVESRSYHEMECAVMPGLLQTKTQNVMRLVARIVFQAGFETLKNYFKEQGSSQDLDHKTNEQKRTAGFNKDGQYVSSDIGTIANLCYHTPQTVEKTLALSSMTAELMKWLQFDKLDFSYDLGGFLMKFLSSVSCGNGNGVMEFHKIQGYGGTLKLLASSVYPTYALINHSCVGNIFYHFYGKTQVVRAGKLITKGSQLFTFSGKSFLKYPKDYRQKDFKENLRLSCRCEACEGDWPVFDQLMPAPGYMPYEVPDSIVLLKSLAVLLNCSVGNPMEGWRVTTETLPLFKNHLNLMDKFGKTRNVQYIMVKQSIRTYYNMLGNHVGNVEDDGLEKCSDLEIEIQTIQL